MAKSLVSCFFDSRCSLFIIEYAQRAASGYKYTTNTYNNKTILFRHSEERKTTTELSAQNMTMTIGLYSIPNNRQTHPHITQSYLAANPNISYFTIWCHLGRGVHKNDIGPYA